MKKNIPITLTLPPPIAIPCINQSGNIISFPIRDIDEVSLYVAAIRYALEHPAEAESLALAARKYVESEHTQATFELALINTEGYFEGNSLLSSEGDSPCAV